MSRYTHISHTISSEDGQDVASGSSSNAREHYQTDKTRAFEDEGDVTDCRSSPRESEKCGYTHISIFDLDKTLLTVNSSFHFGLYLLRHKVLPLKSSISLISFYLQYQAGLLSAISLHERACRQFFEGKPVDQIERLSSLFADQSIKKYVRSCVYAKLRHAQQEGHYTVLLSTSPHFLVKNYAERFAFHDWSSARYEVTHDKKIGGVEHPFLGEHKAEYAMNLSQTLSIPLENVVAYSDSILDIPLLELVGKPVAVSPDRSLRSASIKKGWEILTL